MPSSLAEARCNRCDSDRPEGTGHWLMEERRKETMDVFDFAWVVSGQTVLMLDPVE
jgi:hypothetical protein